MPKFTYHYRLYVNGVYCQDYAVIASNDQEAIGKLRKSTHFDQFALAKIEPCS